MGTSFPHHDIFKGKEVQDFLILGTDTLSRNVDKGLTLDAVLYPKRAQISSASRRKPEITNHELCTFRTLILFSCSMHFICFSPKLLAVVLCHRNTLFSLYILYQV
jgi:hypothetical protein